MDIGSPEMTAECADTSEGVRDMVRDLEVSRYDAVGFSHPELNDLVELAAETAGLPFAAINLMQANTQVTIAAYGIDPSVCAREDSMCNAVLYAGHPVQVDDASRDPRWADHPVVNGERGTIRSYFAQQLTSLRGVVIGTLCVFDEEPGRLSDAQERRLTKIARWIVDILVLRLRTCELEGTIEDLTRARNELRRSNEQLGMFAGQVAHDLRGPVSAVSASLAMLRDEVVDSDQDTTWLLDRALSSTTRMNTLIGDMLAYASVGGRALMQSVDLNETTSLVRDDLASDLSRVQVVGDRLPVVTGDATQLRVVLQNLLANAVKFTSEVPRPLVRVSGGIANGWWWLEVADNGPGVALEQRDDVFGLHAQADPSRGGIGLGLATCHRIVQSHRGTITLHEAPEGGALVRLDIPCTAPAVPSGAACVTV
jgi:signal transduction histidine kinase